jgi:hypothetical protein
MDMARTLMTEEYDEGWGGLRLKDLIGTTPGSKVG